MCDSGVIDAAAQRGILYLPMCCFESQFTSGRPIMASTADTRMYITTELKYHIKKSIPAAMTPPTINLSMFCGVIVICLNYFFRRANGVCEPFTGSPISTNNSQSFGTSTSILEPNLIKPNTSFCFTG